MPGGHDAIVEHSAGAAYEGCAGQTRSEIFDLPDGEGDSRAVSLVCVLNVRTDPQLKVRALSGLLHDVPDGQTLAHPFVYHDPDERRFVLVVPPVLAHTAFEQSAKLLLDIAQDRTAPVPPYVRAFATVIGIDALRSNLEGVTDVDGDELRDATDAQDDSRTQKLDERERGLSEQEAGLIRMGEELTAREGKLDRSRADFVSEVAALEDREREWLEKLESVSHDAEVVPPENADTAWQEVGAVREEATVVAAAPEALMRSTARTLDRDVSEVTSAEVRQQPPPLRTSPPHSGSPPPLRTSPPHSGSPPPLHPERPRTGPPPLHTTRVVDPPPLPAPDVGHAPPPLPAQVSDDEVSPSALPPPLPESGPHASPMGSTRSPEIEPPASFFDHARGRMAMVSDPDGLWLFADLDGAECDAYLRSADLLLQCVVHNGYPVVLLTLTGGDERDAHAVRLPLDGRSPDDLMVLEGLAESYRARVALYVGGGYVDTITVATLREGVARSVLDHVTESTTMPGISAVDAIAHVLSAPPPVDNPDLPFGPARRQASSTVTVRASVEQLASWMRPTKLREAQLVYSVPMHVVEGSARRVLRSAKLYGVALPGELIDAAIEYGVVADRAELAREQLAAFKKHVDSGDNLGEDGTRENWRQLFALADAAGVDVDDAEASAEPPAVTEPRRDDDDDGSEPGPQSSADLKALLHDPERRMGAIAELAARGHPTLVAPIFEVLESMSPGEVSTGVAALVSFGEHAADPLQQGLDSPNLHLRHACALALGRLKLQRSIAPILQRLDTEPTNIWVEIARAMGDFGAFGVRSVVRSLPGASKPERLMVVMAHLANHGAAKDVETLENDTDQEVAMAARKAMARRSRLEWEDLAIRQQRTLTDSSPAARFSQGFYAELSKVDN